MDPTLEPRKRQGSITGTLIARVTDPSDLVRDVSFYRRLGTQAAPGSGPYPPDVVRRPAPGAGVYEYDFVLDTELDTIGTIELVLEDGRTIRSPEQVFLRRNPDAAGYLPLTGGVLTGGLTTPGLISNGAVSARIAYSDSSGGVGLTLANTSGYRRFVFGLQGSENGANDGGDFMLYRYGDTGSWLGAPLSIRRATGVVSFAATPTVGSSPLALSSQLAAYLPLAGGTMSGLLSVKRDGGPTPTHAAGQLELSSTGANPVVLGFHRPGNSALALRHAAANVLELVNQDGAYASYAGASFVTTGGSTSWGSAVLYNGNDWGTSFYPTLGSTGGGGLIMLRRPHIPFHGDGAYVRMATDKDVSSYWDMGLMGDELKIRRSDSSAAFLINRFGAACIDRTDSWTGDLADTRNHLHLRSASDVARRLTLTYSTTGGPGNNGYGVIAAGRIGVGWTLLALQPSGGPVCVGPVPTADHALNVSGKAFATGGLVSGSTEWLASTVNGSSIHGNLHHVAARSSRGLALETQNGTTQGYVAYEGDDFGLKDRNGAWGVRVTTMGSILMGVTLSGDLRDQYGDLIPAVRVGNSNPTSADVARQGTLWVVI